VTTAPPRPPGRTAGFVLPVVWVASVLYAAAWLDRGWVPHDEGVLGQAAERVLAGELPHRGFVEPYTGGLSLLHAGAFAVLGVRLLSLRIVMLVAFAATVPAIYYVARRFLGAWGAGLAVLLAVAWSVPNYPAAVPSWYNLFLAILGAAALLRFTEMPQRRWLLAAGLAGGLSFLVKVPGLYFIAAGLLFLVFLEQEGAVTTSNRTPSRTSVYRVVLVVSLLLFVAALLALVAARPGVRTLVHFVLPGAILAGLLLWRELRLCGPSPARFAASLRLIAPFLTGAAVPVVVFLVPYALQGAVGDLVHGVFVRPATRLTFAAMEPPSVWLSLFATAPLVLFLASGSHSGRWPPWLQGVTLLGMLGVLDSAAGDSPAYQVVWQSVRFLVPAVVAGGAAALARGVAPPDRAPLFLLIALTAMVALVQFPFSAPVYFLYVAPFAILAIAALLNSGAAADRFPSLSAAGFYLAFAILFVNGSSLYRMGQAFVPADASVALALPRAGIRVPAADAEKYLHVSRLVEAHAAGRYIYATPDCPEIYFLTGRSNPFPTLFEFLESGPPDAARVLAALESREVRVVVVNRRPEFSARVDAVLMAALESIFPDSSAAGSFVVRWRS